MKFSSILKSLKRGIGAGIRLLSGRKSAVKRRPKRPAEISLRTPRPDIQLIAIRPIAAIGEFSGVQLSRHTQRAYTSDLKDFFVFLKLQNLWETWATDVAPIHIAEYRNYLLERRKLSKGSVTRKLAVLKSFYKWAQSRGWVEHSPAELVKSFPQTQESKTGFLSDPEVFKVLDSLGRVAHLGRHRALCKVVVETLLMLGIRRSEASSIRVGDIQWLESRWLVRIQGKGDRQRLLPIPPRLEQSWSDWLSRLHDDAPMGFSFSQNPAAWLDWFKRHAEAPLMTGSQSMAPRFGQTRGLIAALSPSEIGRIVRKTCRRAGILNRVSPHMLRATAITHALDQGASHRGVQQMAGWTSPLMLTRYDKRRKDPRFSAIHKLKYAQDEIPTEKAPTENRPSEDPQEEHFSP